MLDMLHAIGYIVSMEQKTTTSTHPLPSGPRLDREAQADEADAELQARIDSDPDVAGEMCPECEDRALAGKGHSHDCEDEG